MRIGIVIVLLALTSCRTAPQREPVWDKPDKTTEGYQKDYRECNYDAQKAFYADINSPMRARYVGEQVFDACMRARGYVGGR